MVCGSMSSGCWVTSSCSRTLSPRARSSVATARRGRVSLAQRDTRRARNGMAAKGPLGPSRVQGGALALSYFGPVALFG